ncbi:Mitochondrial GTPase 1 [Neolecta irregularis DAH-3]|uniref:Mitochondrial GTPase 1 n=1 Tax=Neolecta irregularis (strain DAH-3) TaxID=1198029 RepID=A0A1U7LQ97_NEOID|nr:Mitochondrial GTPase 1 [Neolecta irregularis DAH-3]|eukprot:OLL24846.1 Mitochondrial GTPase 1 [Neolecta irregularis DAH-3]
MPTFVPRTRFPHVTLQSWFPGHMLVGFRKMKALLSDIDLIIEARDARLPISSRNPIFEKEFGNKERIVVYNKRDLAGTFSEDRVRMLSPEVEVIFNNTFDRKSLGYFLGTLKKRALQMSSMKVLIVGMPNVGKSSIINALRSSGLQRGKAVATGRQAGITRKVTALLIPLACATDQDNADRYIGVFIPFVPNPETMLKFALTGCIKDSLYDYHTIADYLLYHLNLYDPSIYMSLCRMNEPTNEIETVLHEVALRTGKLNKGGMANSDAAAEYLVHRYRVGDMGKFVLDEIDEKSVSERLKLEREAKSRSMLRKEASAERDKKREGKRLRKLDDVT